MDNTMSERIAEEIRVLLVRRKLTASEIAQKAGMTQPYISRRLTGETEFGVNDLAKIAAALEVEIGELLPAPAPASSRPDGENKLRSPHTTGQPRSGHLLSGHETSRTADTPRQNRSLEPAGIGPRSRPEWLTGGAVE